MIALYVAGKHGIPYLLVVGEQEIHASLQRTQKVWEDFAGFSRDVPHWYC